MKNTHLSEEEIHTIVFDKKTIDSLILHAQHCENCRNRIRAYELIFNEIKHEPAPTFDFEVINPMLAIPKKSKKNHSPILLFIFASATFALLAFGLTQYLSKFSNGTLLFNWLIIITAAIIFIGLLVDILNRNEKKLKALND